MMRVNKKWCRSPTLYRDLVIQHCRNQEVRKRELSTFLSKKWLLWAEDILKEGQPILLMMMWRVKLGQGRDLRSIRKIHKEKLQFCKNIYILLIKTILEWKNILKWQTPNGIIYLASKKLSLAINYSSSSSSLKKNQKKRKELLLDKVGTKWLKFTKMSVI